MSLKDFSITLLETVLKKRSLYHDSADAYRNVDSELLEILKDAEQYKTNVPGHLNFIWIGDCSKADFSYLPVWLHFNKNKKVQLWTDESSSQCHYLRSCLEKWSHAHPRESLCDLQNKAFNYIYPRIVSGETFNSVADEFLFSYGITSETAEFHKGNIKKIPYKIISRDI